MRLPIPITVIGLVLAGCAAEAAPPASFTARDSAGVRIVDYGGTPSDAPAFTLAAEPVYRVGDEPGEHEFTSIWMGALLPDGAAAVVDGMRNQELILIAPDGATSTIARPGRGPTELARAVGIRALAPRSFVVVDYENEKMMLFEDGALDRSISTADGAPIARAAPVGYAPPATLLMSTVGPTDVAREGWLQAALMRFDLESHVLDTVGTFDRTRQRAPGGRTRLFGSFGLASGSGALFLTWRNDVPQVTWWSADGAVRQVLRWKATPTYPTQAHLDAYVERQAASVRALNPGMPRDRLEDIVRRDRERYEIDTSQPFPLFSSVRGDGQGGVWLSPYRTGVEDGSDQIVPWIVIAQDGQWLGSVRFPDGFRLLDVYGDRVLGVLRDAMDVESVAVFTLTPEPRAP
jgi:hypothetical protein